MVYVFLADGFEEIEAIAPIDILRRAQIEVVTVGVTGTAVTGAHGIQVSADTTIDACTLHNAEALILPGGMPGTSNLEANETLNQLIQRAVQAGTYVAAICAAPSIFGHLGLLQGKRATCFPSYEGELTGAIVTASPLEIDGNIITSRGAGTAADFAFALVSLLAGEDTAHTLRHDMQFYS